jgi:putative membrane protein
MPRFVVPLLVAALAGLSADAPRARADAAGDSVYLVGEFVDPVCWYQHGMQGVLQRTCAMVDGRVEQGMAFLDLRERKVWTVIGVTHWTDPKAQFLAILGDTVAVSGKRWERGDSRALAITAVHPWRQQPPPRYRAWPWHWEWTVLTGCGVLALLLALAIGPWRRRLGAPDDRPEHGRLAVFAGGLAVVVLALNGPVHDLSDLYLFSAHMVQHLMLSQIVPPLLVLGVPPWLRERLVSGRVWAGVWDALTRVPVGFLLYSAVFAIWHVPTLYDLMMRDHNFHVIMHLMVMATAVLMWWPVCGGSAVRRPLPAPAQMLYLFLLGIPMMGVAALITFAGRPLYEWYALAPRFMGLDAVEDQRLGGLIMWVPGGLFWWGVMSIVFFRWAARESRSSDDPAPAGAGAKGLRSAAG